MVKLIAGSLKSRDQRICIVVSRFNEFITKKLLEGCLKELDRLGIKDKNISVVWVPGAFEIPVIALKAAQKKIVDCVICLGAIIRGETIHFELVAEAASRGIAKVSLSTGKPVIFGVLSTNTLDQAYKRSGLKENKGIEAARNAVEMIDLIKQFK